MKAVVGALSEQHGLVGIQLEVVEVALLVKHGEQV